MVERVQDTPSVESAILVMGTVAGRAYQATIEVNALDQLAELAARQPGRMAQQGPVRVTILSTQALNVGQA